MNEKATYWFNRFMETVMREDYLPMTRLELQTRLAHAGTFQLFAFYYAQLELLLANTRKDSASVNVLQTHPYQSVVFAHTLRFKRYAMALARMFPTDGKKVVLACQDGSYPILKSLFELIVESRMARAYLQEFEDTPESRKQLADRILTFTDLNKKKANFKFNFINVDDLNLDAVRPESMNQYAAAGKDQHMQDIEDLAKKLGDDIWRKTNHWYPTKNRKGEKVISGKRSDFGSIRWRCEDVLANHLPDDSERLFWSRAYVSIYEVLNFYSHPSQGYDDCLRPDAERLYDFFKISAEMVLPMHLYVLPELLANLLATSPVIKNHLNNVDESAKKLLLMYQALTPLIEKQEREGFNG